MTTDTAAINWITIANPGSDRPTGLPADAIILCKLKDGSMQRGSWRADVWNWGLTGDYTIVAYSVVNEGTVEPQVVPEATPKLYTIRQVAEAIEAVSGTTRVRDFELKIEQLQKHLDKVTDPEYTEYLDAKATVERLKAKFE